MFSHESDILDLSKVEAAKIDFDAVALSPAGLVHGPGPIVGSPARDNGLAPDVRIEPHVPVRRGDPLNTELLLELFDGDGATVAAILTAAIELIGADAKRIEVGLDTHDAQLVIEAAHRLKGTAGSLHANTLLECAAVIETAMKQGSSSNDVGAHVSELRRAIVALDHDIQAYSKQNDCR